MTHTATSEYVNTRNFSARTDGRTEIKCPAKLGQVIGCGRCVEMQNEGCPLQTACPYAPIAREANRLALVATSEHMPRHMAKLKPCLWCGEPVSRDRNKTCSTECNAKWMSKDRRHRIDPNNNRSNERSTVRGVHVKVVDDEMEAAIRGAIEDGLNNEELKERFGIAGKSARRLLRRRDLQRSTPAETTQRATDRQES